MQVYTILGMYELDSEGWQNPDTFDIFKCMDNRKINRNRETDVRKIVEAVGAMLHSMYHEEVFAEVSMDKIQSAANMAIRHLFNNIG